MGIQQMIMAAGTSIYEGYIAVAHYVSPYISVYPWTSGTGFGTKYSDPSTVVPSYANGVAFSPEIT